MSTSAGRIFCPQCGASNFDTQAACWKCGAALVAGGTPSPSASSSGMGNPAPALSAVNTPQIAALPPRPAANVDPSVASGAAIALALLFPFVAVPAGLIFMMFDDKRRLEVGKITLIWGIVGTIGHTILTGIAFKAAVDSVAQSVPIFQRLRQQGGGGGGDMGEDPIPSPKFPGQ